MHERIVVPLDDTAGSQHAVATAVALARAWAVPVQLVTVISPGIDPLLARLALERLGAGLGVEHLPPEVIAGNDVAEALTSFAGRLGLLCMATHGRSAFGTAVLGSVAHAVLAASTEPVLLVGPQCAPANGVHDICVAVEPGSPLNVGAVDVASAWATRSGARLHLVSAVRAADALVIGDTEARNELGMLAQGCRDHGVTACWQVVRGDDIAARIASTASDVSASVLVAATHGRGPLGRLVLGSIAQQLIRRAPCPVLAIPSHPTNARGS